MARARIPCDFCGGDFESSYIEHRNGYCIWLEVYPTNNLLAFMAQANDESGEMIEDEIEVTMNYCPACGRKIEGI